jgi:hypothetical protein
MASPAISKEKVFFSSSGNSLKALISRWIFLMGLILPKKTICFFVFRFLEDGISIKLGISIIFLARGKYSLSKLVSNGFVE